MDKGSSWITAMPQTLLVASCAVALTIVAMILGSIAWFDKVLSDNPDLKQQLEQQQIAYMESLANSVKDNPWGSTIESVENPKAYLMAMFIGKSPAFRAKLSNILDSIPESKILFLVRVFKSVELSDAQLNRFIALVDRIINSNNAAPKLQGMINIAERAVKEKLKKSKESETPLEQTQDSEEGKEKAQEGEELTDIEQPLDMKEEDVEDAIDLLTVEDPEAIDDLLTAIAELPPELAAMVTDILGSLAGADSDKLLAILDQFNRGGIKAVVSLLAKLSNQSVKSLVNRYDSANKGQITKATKVLNQLPPPTTEKLIKVTSSLSNRTFFTAVDLVSSFDNRSVGTFIAIGGKVGGSKFADVVDLLDSVNGQTQKSALELMDNISNSHISKLLTVSNKLNPTEIRKGVDVLYDVRSSTLQQNAIEIFDNLSSKNLKNAIGVMDQISLDSTKKSIRLTHEFQQTVQNKVFDQFSRVVTKSDSLSTGTSQPNTIYGFQGTRVKPARIELLIDKLGKLNNLQLAQDIVAAGDGLSDKGLNQAADVFIDLDTQSDPNRVNRLIRVYKRSSTRNKEDIVDTLDDLSVRHVSAAVDIVDRVEDNLLSDSLQLTKLLKKDLGRKEGLDATMRAINIASKVDNQEELNRGVAVMKTQNSVTLRKVLKQIDNNPQTYSSSTVNKMTALHQSLEKNKSEKLTNIISGEDGFTVGAKIGGGGASRQVTEARKNLRIREYFDNRADQEKNKNKLNFITSRPILVNTNKESNFTIKSPTAVAGVRGKPRKVFEIKVAESGSSD